MWNSIQNLRVFVQEKYLENDIFFSKPPDLSVLIACILYSGVTRFVDRMHILPMNDLFYYQADGQHIHAM